MSKKIALVGHCGPDSSYLRSTIMSALKGAKILAADDDEALGKLLVEEVDLLLFNRELGYGFAQSEGVQVIGKLRSAHPELRMMLVSNYPDAQAAAVTAGALPGFGKREIGTKRVIELLQNAVQ